MRFCRCMFATVLLAVNPVMLSASGKPQEDGTALVSQAPALSLSAFRIRHDARAPMALDLGWAAAESTPARIPVEQPFGLRFELESPTGTQASVGLTLQHRRAGERWQTTPVADFPYPDHLTPVVSIVALQGDVTGTITTDLLGGSSLPFLPGRAASLENPLPAVLADPPGAAGAAFQTEIEWSLVLRRFADGPTMTEHGTIFEFRLLNPHGQPLSGASWPSVEAIVPDGLLAGTFIETPERLGPWQSADGTLYFLMEPSESDNRFMIVGSTDGGRGWEELDGAGRPATRDLEGVASAFHDGRIHILHQTSQAVLYHAFATRDEASGPDRWKLRDQVVASPDEPPVQVTALQARPDGSLLGIYGGPIHLHWRVRDPQGAWGDENTIAHGPETIVSGPQTALDRNGTVHLAYSTRQGREGAIWYRTIDQHGTLGAAMQIATTSDVGESDSGPVAPLAFLADSGEVVMVYTVDGDLFERRALKNGALGEPLAVSERSVAQNTVDSDQIGADVVSHGDQVHVLFIDADTGGLFHACRMGTGPWSPTRLVRGGTRVQWVRGALARNPQGKVVYAFVYDAGSNGGSGMNHYGEIDLEKACSG